MKFIAVAFAFLSANAFSNTLTVKLTLNGIDAKTINAPTATFVALNPVCTNIVVVPQPTVYPETVDVKGTVKVIDANTVELTAPTTHPKSFCLFSFEDINFNSVKRLETVSFLNSAIGTDKDSELDVLTHAKSQFEVDCVQSRCRVLRDGSQVGYGSGNVATLFLDKNKLKSPQSVKLKLSVH